MNISTESNHSMSTEQYMHRARRYRSLAIYRTLRAIRNWINKQISCSPTEASVKKQRHCHCHC